MLWILLRRISKMTQIEDEHLQDGGGSNNRIETEEKSRTRSNDIKRHVL